jgi:hypothetical protein
MYGQEGNQGGKLSARQSREVTKVPLYLTCRQSLRGTTVICTQAAAVLPSVAGAPE